jgi:hypothetical protein
MSVDERQIINELADFCKKTTFLKIIEKKRKFQVKK